MNGRTALAYIRVSVVGDRAKRGRFESPDLQRAAIDAWCQARAIEVVDEIRDLNRSGGHLTRPGLEQAMGLVPTLADGIVVARGDRASRPALDGLGLLDQLEKAGGWIAGADGTIDTSTRTATMATTMHLAMAESELERYRETSAVAHQCAIVDKGRHMGGTPFGYRRDADKRLVIHEPPSKWVKWIFEQRAGGRGWASMSRELTERGVRQGTGRKLTHHMLRRMVTHRVYLGHGKDVHPAAHPALIDPVLFEAANRVLPGAPPRRAGRVNVIGGLPRCAGCSYVLKPLITRAGDYRWLCRTRLAEQSATYECPAPARIRGSEHDALKRLVVDAAKKFAASVGVETADDQRFEAAQRARGR
ncbi:MAG: recombinase family protein [Solirubrobacteraceae bacterium]